MAKNKKNVRRKPIRNKTTAERRQARDQRSRAVSPRATIRKFQKSAIDLVEQRENLRISYGHIVNRIKLPEYSSFISTSSIRTYLTEYKYLSDLLDASVNECGKLVDKTMHESLDKDRIFQEVMSCLPNIYGSIDIISAMTILCENIRSSIIAKKDLPPVEHYVPADTATDENDIPKEEVNCDDMFDGIEPNQPTSEEEHIEAEIVETSDVTPPKTETTEVIDVTENTEVN